MPDSQPGSYSVTMISSMDEWVRHQDKEKAIANAIALLEREGFTVTRPKKNRKS